MTTNLEICLVRHGQTEHNVAARLQGWCDSPLTAEGEEAAAALGRALADQQPTPPFQAAFCSTLPRTVATARIILRHARQNALPLTELDDLREYHFGDQFEGKPAYLLYQAVTAARGLPDTASWLNEYRNGRHNLLAETLPSIDPSAESEDQFLSRLQRGFQEVVRQSPEQGRVLVVTHGMVIVALLKTIDPDAITYQSPPNVSVSRLHYDGRDLRILSVGEVLPAPTE